MLESIRVALQSIAANKLRAALTMLGMIIGVAAVIALVAAGAGTQVRDPRLTASFPQEPCTRLLATWTAWPIGSTRAGPVAEESWPASTRHPSASSKRVLAEALKRPPPDGPRGHPGVPGWAPAEADLADVKPDHARRQPGVSYQSAV